MSKTYNSGRKRVHWDDSAQRIVDAIQEYARYAACALDGKRDTNEPGQDQMALDLAGTAADLCEELALRLRERAAP